MKIGYVSKFLPEKDGGAIYAERLCAAMPCKVVRIGDLESEADYSVNLRSLWLKEKLARIIKKEKLDLIHFQYVLDGSYFGKYNLKLGLVRAMKQKVPVIVTFTEVHTECNGLKERVLCWLQKALANRAAASVSHTKLQAEYMKRYRSPSYRINMGLVLRKVKPRKDKQILFLGMLGIGKGVEYLIKAMDYLPDYKLAVAGSSTRESYAHKMAVAGSLGGNYEELLRKAAAENRHDNVKLDIRWIPEEVKNEYYARSDVAVLPYVWAPYQSGVLHDTMSFGKPVVVSRTGGVWEIVEEYNTGVVVPPKDPSAIAEGVKKVMSNYSKYQTGIRKYQKDANWEAVGKKHCELYKRILGNN